MHVLSANCELCYLFTLFTYIPWIRGVPHLDIGIVNIDMDATIQCTYEYKYGIRQQLVVR
jgi:hypothetical protein